MTGPSCYAWDDPCFPNKPQKAVRKGSRNLFINGEQEGGSMHEVPPPFSGSPKLRASRALCVKKETLPHGHYWVAGDAAEGHLPGPQESVGHHTCQRDSRLLAFVGGCLGVCA